MGQSKKDGNSRPGWRGPGKTKPSRAHLPPKKKDPDPAPEPSIPWQLQQRLLNIFRNTFVRLLEDGQEDEKTALQENIHEMKHMLFERDFVRAFGRPDFLVAYTFRWSPSRALCYATVLVDLQEYLSEILPPGWNRHVQASGFTLDETGKGIDEFHVTCFGGGAAEVVAFGGFLHQVLENSISSQPTTDDISLSVSAGESSLPSNPLPKLNLHLIDVALWSPIAIALNNTLTTPPPLSKYASENALAAAAPLIPSSALSVSFTVSNIITLNPKEISSLLAPSRGKPQLITILFTLNELYTTSVPKTTAFLLHLTASVPRGTILLIIDSPGSYSIARIGGDIDGDGNKSGSGNGSSSDNISNTISNASKSTSTPIPKTDTKPAPYAAPEAGSQKTPYPMIWLLDRTLLGEGEKEKSSDEKQPPKWEKLVSNTSKWFRLPAGLKYPHPLENMRYQIHLFRRV